MAHYEHLSIYRTAFDLTVHIEQIVSLAKQNEGWLNPDAESEPPSFNENDNCNDAHLVGLLPFRVRSGNAQGHCSMHFIGYSLKTLLV